MDTRQHIKRAIDMLGGPVAAARVLGAKRYQTVQQWIESGNVPAKYAPEIEAALHGTVRCEDLCPNVNWSYLRSTSN